MAAPVTDVRSALAALEGCAEHLRVSTDPIYPYLELASRYRAIGAGTPTPPPTRTGPAMLYENVRGYPGARILVGLLARRDRAAWIRPFMWPPVSSRPPRRWASTS